jgi:dCTP deaminase
MPNTKSGTLSDDDIKSLCSKGILIEDNFTPAGIKQACYELRCSNIFYDLDEGDKRQIVNGTEYILLKPKQTLVIITLESLRLPNDILGRILTKGMLFSIGILPVNTYADPGFSGRLGIVMHNLSNSYIKLQSGDTIAKIEFSRLEHPVSRPYEGQHGYQTNIWPIRKDMILDPAEEKRDARIGKPYDEMERAYGKDLGKVMKRVFGYERRILLFASLYFLIMILLIAAMSRTNWITTTTAILIGVAVNILSTIIIYIATNLWGRQY